MIVVEGYDGTGKSTVAEKIGLRLDAPVHHAGGPPRDEADVMGCAARSLWRMNAWCVQDRVTQVSHSVYAMLRRPRESAIALARIGDLRAARLLVYCRPSRGTILANVERHKAKCHDTDAHVSFVRAHADALICVYDTVIELARPYVPIATYDYENDDLEKLMAHIERMTRL